MRAAVALIVACAISYSSSAQLVLSGNKTAGILSSALVGAGVTILSPTLTCAGNANATFTTGAVSPIGIASGIVLTTGNAVDTLGGYGVAHPDHALAGWGSHSNGTPGDPLLATLVTTGTHDACILEFDFKPAGDTIKFNYVFGSEEYNGYTCSDYNDVFGFFISGGAYTTPTNLALVPGTSIPVAVNSVNCGADASWSLSTCTDMGPGSPFCVYYVDNTLTASPAYNYVTYDGLTTLLQVVARVSPCDTYHLKLAIADAGDEVWDSGVFIEGGSLSSNTPTAVTATGTSGLPYCIRGCAPGNFVFSTPTPQDTNIVIHYVIGGTAGNGYDYATITDSSIIVAHTTSDTVDITTLAVPPVGPKVVTLTIMVPDPCHPGVYTPGGTASLTILDSFTFRILTPDTAICDGSFVHLVATGDTIFDSILHYTWTPNPTISNDTTLITDATPTVTTIYTLTATTAAVLGCAPEFHSVKITVFNPTFDSVSVTNPTVCGYCDGTLKLWGLQTGFPDTLFYTYNGSPQPPRPITVASGGPTVITNLCTGTYSNIYVKAGICYTLTKGPKTIVNPPPPVVTVDSPLVKTCVGIPVQLHAYVTPPGIPYFYTWSPATDLNNSTISNPIVTPSVPGDITYTVTVNPDTVAACAATATIRVHTVPNNFTLNNNDTAICIGQFVQTSISGGSPEFTWLWTPSAGVSDVNIMAPVITPTVSNMYIITASYAHCPNMVDSFHIEVDFPAPTVTYTDTICLGAKDSIDLTVTTQPGYYHYQWAPATFVSNDTIPNPIITPTVGGSYSWTITIQPHAAACAITDVLNLLVIPNSFTVTPTDTAICKGASVQILGTPYPLFSYHWSPTEGIPNANIINPLITSDTPTVYVVTATYFKCPDMHDTVRIDVQPNPSAYIGGNQFVCQYDTLHLHAWITPGWYQNYIYNWSPSLHLDNSTTSTVVFGSDTSTTLIFSVTTSAGCSAMDSAHITVYPNNFASMTPSIMDFCPHDSAIISPAGGVAYNWSPSLYLNDSNALQPVIKPITNQTYTIIATSQYGCLDTLTFTALVHPGAVINIDAGDSITLYPGETYQIDPQTNCTYFEWFPPAGLSYAYISNPVASPQISTKYVVYGTTEWGCKTKDSINVYVDDESLLTLPNAFTPGSGVNNEFKIIKRGIATLNYFRIFNRWGNLVFETSDINKGWNGEYNGTPQPMGVFVYEVEAVTSTGKIFKKHGNTTLIR